MGRAAALRASGGPRHRRGTEAELPSPSPEVPPSAGLSECSRPPPPGWAPEGGAAPGADGTDPRIPLFRVESLGSCAVGSRILTRCGGEGSPETCWIGRRPLSTAQELCLRPPGLWPGRCQRKLEAARTAFAQLYIMGEKFPL
jgi:hypothetical protein